MFWRILGLWIPPGGGGKIDSLYITFYIGVLSFFMGANELFSWNSYLIGEVAIWDAGFGNLQHMNYCTDMLVSTTDCLHI